MFLIVSKQLCIMFILMMVGFVCRRIRIIDHHSNNALSNLLLLVVTPSLILNSFQIERTTQLLKEVFLCMGLALLAHILMIIIAQIVIPDTHPSASMERISAIYSNCGFIGIPLIQAVLGSKGVIYISAYILVYNALVWTHGLLVVTGNASFKQLKKGLLSPMMICIAIGLVCFVLNIRFPSIMGQSIGYISNLNTPVAMMISGCVLAECDLLGALKKKGLYLASFLKLIVMPLAALAVYKILHVPHDLLITMVIACACPCGATGTMLALRYNKDYKYTTEIYTVCTLISLITIPLIALIL